MPLKGDNADLPSKYIISHKGPMGTSSQQSTAAAFFARSHSKTSSPVHNLLQAAKSKKMGTNFASILENAPPPTPSYLLKRLELSSGSHETPSPGKVKVVLRVANSGLLDTQKTGSFFYMDRKKKQVTLTDPANSSTISTTIRAPKMFAFDGLFTEMDSQIELAGTAITDSIHSVLTGTDGCLFSFGHARLGKTRTMIGSDESSKTIGIIPTAIAWLYRCIKENKTTKYSVRVTACEIFNKNGEEILKDLLATSESRNSPDFESPSLFLPSSSLLSQQSELRCSTAEKAGQYLDIALNNRTVPDSHFIYVMSVYRADASKPGNLIGGRSRLYLVDFGGCDRGANGIRGGITQSGLGNVILGIFNGSRHLPSKDSKVTQMIKECLNSTFTKATMISHVTPEASHYSETLHTIQLASRIHRMRRCKRNMKGSGSSGGGGSGSGSSDDANKNKMLVNMHGLATSSSDFTDPSSSEQSCDTVIYVGPRDDDGTDAEHPPVYIPNLNSGDNRGVMSKALRGSAAEIPPHLNLSFERQKNALPSTAHSSPMNSGGRCRPGSVGSTPVKGRAYNMGRGSLPRNPKGKMPLYGKVAGYRQAPKGSIEDQRSPHHRNNEIWVDGKVPHITKLTPEQQYAIYGYMDDFKRGMIQQWVTEQQQVMTPKRSSHHHHHHSQHTPHKEPEPFAWLKESEDINESSDGCKVLTQFKVVESSDESFSEGKEDIITVDVHSSSVMTNSFESTGSCGSNPLANIESRSRNVKDEVPGDKEDEEILRVSGDVAEIVKSKDLIGKENSPDKIMIEEKQEDVSSSSSSCPPPAELNTESLHYIAKKKPTVYTEDSNLKSEFASVCNDGENFDNKIDQLAKLHELYQSVSSINAKSQNRLKNGKNEEDNNMGSCFSLGALRGNEEEVSHGESVKSDLNSLCSEPVIQRFDNSSLDIEEAVNDLCKFTVSLSDLKKGLFFGRSDSPVLEGMDGELAKYAKLKNLERSYELTPPLSSSTTQDKVEEKETTEIKKKRLEKQLEEQIIQLEQLRHPDGASNPDLNVSAVRRSPGNGRSDPELDEEKTNLVPRDKQTVNMDRKVLGKSSSSSSGSFTSRPRDDVPDKSDDIWQIQPEKNEQTSGKSTPKFSRLFSGSIKKHRSHAQKEKKTTTNTKRSSSTPAPRDESSKKQSSHRRLKFFSRSSHKAKNAISTPSSDTYSSRSKKSKNKPLSSTYIPSPYSFPSAPVKKTTASSSTSSGRGSITEYDCNTERQQQRQRVKMRTSGGGRGAKSNHCKSSGYESVSERDSVEEDIKIIVSEGAQKRVSPEPEEPSQTLTRIYPETNKLPPMSVIRYENDQVQRMDRRWRFWEFSKLKDRQKNLKVAMRDAKSRISRSSSVRWSYELHVEENSGVDKSDPSFIEALRKETDILQKRVEACKSHATLMTCFDAIPSDIQNMDPYSKKQWESCCTTDCDPPQNMILSTDPKESEIF